MTMVRGTEFSWLERLPVTQEAAGSSLCRSAILRRSRGFGVRKRNNRWLKRDSARQGLHNFRVEAQDRSCNFFPDITVDIIFVCSRIHTHYRTIAKKAIRGLLVVIGGRCNYLQLCCVHEAANLP